MSRLRFCLWFCVLFAMFDFGVMVYETVSGRWGYAISAFTNCLIMIFFWQFNAHELERRRNR